MPSQEWLGEDFGLALHIQPNYEDFSCKWQFSKAPPPLAEDEAILVPCFARCPSEFKGQKDAIRQVLGAPSSSGLQALEAIAQRASPEALADAAVRLTEVKAGGKCWSISDGRTQAVGAAQVASRAGAAADT